jgi:hypothetical protein
LDGALVGGDSLWPSMNMYGVVCEGVLIEAKEWWQSFYE